MTEPTHHEIPTTPRPGLLTQEEIMRNIAIKASMRPAVDSQGRPVGPAQAVAYEYDDLGRITGASVSAADAPAFSALDYEASPAMQAMREKAERNHQAIVEFGDLCKNDPAALGNYQH